MFVIAVNDIDLSIRFFVSFIDRVAAAWLERRPLVGVLVIGGACVAGERKAASRWEESRRGGNGRNSAGDIRISDNQKPLIAAAPLEVRREQSGGLAAKATARPS